MTPEDPPKDAPRFLRDTVPADSDPDKPPTPAFFAPGDVVGGSYVIREVLGYGGMGVVYEAEDRELDRVVALKVPLVGDYAQALRREAQAMARVRHPNLVAVHSIGRHEGVDFIVMERLFGKTLEAHIEAVRQARQRIGVDEAVELLAAVTDALTAVHQAGLAHRDVKTANVMLAGERIVLTDLGLVLPEFAVKGNRAIAGSADYMAPEVITGSVRPGEGALVDLYAMGALAFMILTGHGPYPAEGLEDTLRAHVYDAVPDLRDERPDVPADLAELVTELLAKIPEDRPESAESLLWRLHALRIARPSRRGSAPLSVLLVDDQEEVCSVLKRGLLFSLPGIAVESVTDPVRALARCEEHPFDVVVVDLHMPKMNGLELAMSLFALPRRPTVVAMSGEATDADIAVLGELGIAAFVPKDARFVARLCAVIGDVRRKREPSIAPPRSGPS